MSYQLIRADCFEWMSSAPKESVTAIVTDPPYGVKEYTESEITKQRSGSGGIWRIPPSFDGHERRAVPRFSILSDNEQERSQIRSFFLKWGILAKKILVPGGHIFLASTPLLSDIVSGALREAGLERRGEIIRTVMTLRGGDRPKGAEREFDCVSVIPRGLWEPWLLFRNPLSERTIAANLRKWNAGALRRPSKEKPLCDFIESEKTPKAERDISNHPSLKPQSFLRKLV